MFNDIELLIEQYGFEPRPGHCVVFLGKTLSIHRSSPYPGVQMGTGKFNAGVGLQ